VRVIAGGVNKGLPTRLNEGLDLARSPFVARMDSDDIAFPLRLERQLAFMRANTDVAICGSWYQTFEDGRIGWFGRLPLRHADIAAHTVFNAPFGHPTVMFRKPLLDRHGLRYDPLAAHAEDYDLWERAHSSVRMANIPEILLAYRLHAAQVSKRFAAQRDVSDRVRRRALQRFGISLTDREFRIHCALSSFEPFPPDIGVSDVRAWLTTLHDRAGRFSAYGRALRRQCRARAPQS
jgi:glycosyltransferase involved in cell wall biosynthesis